MAFPVNGILDNFNRADSTTTVGTSWTAFSAVGVNSGNEGILSNQLYNPFGSFSNYTAMYWNLTGFGPDCEAYITIVTLPGDSSNDKPIIYTRLTHIAPLGTDNGYYVSYFDSNGGIFISRLDTNVGTQLGATITQSQTAGDKIGIQIIGSTITYYYFTSGAWNNVGSRSDVTYLSFGDIGWYIPGNTQNGRFDDFGGGGLVSDFIGYKTLKGVGL